VISSQYILAERLRELEDYIDVVVIDTAPSASIMHTVVYHASTHILHPTECQFLSLNGLVSTLERRSIPNIEQQGITAVTLGIIPTKYRSNTLEQKENFEELQTRYGELVWEPIKWRTIWTEAAPTMSAVWMLDPKSPAVDEINNIINRVIQVVVHG
jgi:chromosome partitioning protein